MSGEQAFQVAEQRRQRFRLERGSNAIAVGSERSADGKGMLLANPHFLERRDAFLPDAPDHSRPARRDGASLPGLPLVNIGFSRHLAWTHTVDTSSHFTLYRLALDPKDPRRYLVDGRSLPLEEKSVAIEVRGADGKLSRVEHKVYQSIYGPLVVWPGKLDWNRSEAYALRDANLRTPGYCNSGTRSTRPATSPTCAGASRRYRGSPGSTPWPRTSRATSCT